MIPFTLTADTIAQCITAAISAGLGTWAAFRIEARRDDIRKKESQSASLKAALFVLAQQRTFLLNLGQQVLEPSRNQPMRAYMILPLSFEASSLNLNVNDLMFMLEGDAELLNELELTDRLFRQVHNLLEVRGEAHATMQERLMSAIPQTDAVSLPDLRKAVGPIVANKLEQTTTGLYEMHDKALASNRSVYEKLDAATRRRFPKLKIFKMAELPPVSDRDV